MMTYATDAVVFARIAHTFVVIVELAARSRHTGRAAAEESLLIGTTAAAVLARIRVALRVGIAVFARESRRTDARVSRLGAAAHAAVVARRALAEVDLHLAVASHESRFAVAAVVVDQLDAVEGPARRAGIREAFVDVALAARTHEARRTLALETADLVHACSSVMTCSCIF